MAKEWEKFLGILLCGFLIGIQTTTFIEYMTGQLSWQVKKKCQEEAVQHGYAHWEVKAETPKDTFIWNK